MSEERAFEERLKQLRKKKGITQEELGKILGVGKSTICQYERGTRKPDIEMLKRIAQFFGVSIDYLLGGSNPDISLIPGTYPAGKLVPVPVYGIIRAGEPIYAEENIIDYCWVSEEDIMGGEYFFLRVTGDSMRNAGIFDGSLVLVRKQSLVDNGSIAVVLVRETGEATVKKYYSQNGMIILKPENPNYDLQIYKPDEIMVLGEVIQAIKRFK